MSYISVIGAGSWGTTLASLLAEKGYDVCLWSHEEEVAEEIRERRRNSAYLSDVVLPAGLKATHDLEEAVKKARYILNVVPTQFTRSVFAGAAQFIREGAVIVSASKGTFRDWRRLNSNGLHWWPRRNNWASTPISSPRAWA